MSIKQMKDKLTDHKIMGTLADILQKLFGAFMWYMQYGRLQLQAGINSIVF